MAQFIPLAITAAQGLMQASAQKQSAAFNQAMAEREATFQRNKTALELEREARTAKRRRGTQIAALSKSGRFGTESALDILEAQAREDELDAMIIRFGGEAAAQGFGTEATRQKRAGVTQPAGTLLSTGAKAFSLMGK